jgi:hypothetical protein
MDTELAKALRERIHPSLVYRNARGFDHIKSHTVIDRLIQSGAAWSFTITDTRPSYNQHGQLVHVAMLGALTVNGETRSDWGEAATTNNPTEELFKSCQSDVIKRCGRMFGIALELYGDMIDEQTGEHIGRPVQHQVAVTPLNGNAPAQPRQSQPYQGGGDQTGRKTYPTPGQLKIAEPTAKAAGLDWTTQADDIIFAALGKSGPLYRNDEFQDVVLWMQRHEGQHGQWSYDQEGHLVLGPVGPAMSMARAEVADMREDSMDDVPF